MRQQIQQSSDQPSLSVRLRSTLFSLSRFIFRSTLAIAVLLGSSIGLSKLGVIHGKDLPEEYFSNGYPTILKLLDSEVFMGLVFFVTIAILVYVLYLLWELHEIAVKKASRMSSAHTQIVFALSLCGLFIDKTWWVLAIVIAFTRWDAVGQAISSVIYNGRTVSSSANKVDGGQS